MGQTCFNQLDLLLKLNLQEHLLQYESNTVTWKNAPMQFSENKVKSRKKTMLMRKFGL